MIEKNHIIGNHKIVLLHKFILWLAVKLINCNGEVLLLINNTTLRCKAWSIK